MLHKRDACAKLESGSEGTAIFSSSPLLLTHSIAMRPNRICKHSMGAWVLLWLLCFLAQGCMFSFMTRKPAFIGFLFHPGQRQKELIKVSISSRGLQLVLVDISLCFLSPLYLHLSCLTACHGDVNLQHQVEMI